MHSTWSGRPVRKKPNSIKPREHGVEVELDPNFLLNHQIYLHDGEKVVKSTMTVAQVIEGLAYAHVVARKPEWKEKCRIARVKFEEGKYLISFADDLDHLSFP